LKRSKKQKQQQAYKPFLRLADGLGYDFPAADRRCFDPYISSRLPEEQNFPGNLFGCYGHEVSFKTSNFILLPATTLFLSFNSKAELAPIL
jgi:hypothetical protein